ncbi:MAG: cobalt-precorrin-6A reductase [Solirubrobacteraceae bacterium]|nr:cobalt-precorrin-6A reductase [Solirubrobacteraceae bacterium]
MPADETEQRTVLVLGGTGEARALAAALVETTDARVVSSLAGRVARPRLPVGETRIGGFGGPEKLAAWLAEEGVGCVVDATHPFAERISASAARASIISGVPILRLQRPGWTARDGDDWHWVDTLEEAAALLPRFAGRGASVGSAVGEGGAEAGASTQVPPVVDDQPGVLEAPDAQRAPARVLLTTGRQGLASFRATADAWFLIRCVDPPEPADLPPHHELLLDRGPYTLEGELALIDHHRIDVVATKDSGGALTVAKLDAARKRGLPVVLVRRPAGPPIETVDEVDAAATWARALLAV